MLKTVSSIANAIGALNYKGTWDANANSPALTSSVGTKGDYYVVGTAGATNLNGISNWGIGDWAVFNGAVWQRVEGGANLNGVDLSVSGTSQLTGNATFSNNLVQGTAAKGVNFTANTPAVGMTSQLLNWYEEGTWTPVMSSTSGLLTTVGTCIGSYTRIGRVVQISFSCSITTNGTGSGAITITGLPFAPVGVFIGGSGRELASNKNIVFNVSNGINNISYMTLYDGTYPGGNGVTFASSFSYVC